MKVIDRTKAVTQRHLLGEIILINIKYKEKRKKRKHTEQSLF